MGVKGDKNTQDSNLTAEAVLAKLEPVGGITSKRMFGGHGIFCNGKMFGMIDSRGNVYLKLDDSNTEEFLKLGSEKHSKMPYYKIPEAVLADHNMLLFWANKAVSGLKK